MTCWSPRVAGIALLGVIVLWTAFADASVTWRRVTKPTQKPVPRSVIVSTTTTTTKPPVVWKRSTIARRSTDAVERRDRADDSEEFDEIEEAGSRHAEYLADEGFESESSVTPLVPGSRPGFWFDSSRRRKPSSLLRPQLRRNSLFPTRSSKTTTPTTIAVSPLTVIPRTVPPVTLSNTRNASTKHFGRNRSTKTPIAFRRRVKTTKVPKISSTTEIPDEEETGEEENVLTEPINGREKEDLQKPSSNVETESKDLRPRPLNRNFRRRPYNGSRLSWTKQNKQDSRTTPVPQQLTTTTTQKPTSASGNEVTLRKATRIPKTRTRSKIKSSTAEVAWSRSRKTTAIPTTSTKSNRFPEEVTPRSSLKKISNKRNQNLDLKSDDEMEEFIEKPSHKTNEDFGSKRPSERPKLKSSTTVEPYFITRDYGQIVTAFHEIGKEKENVATIATESIKGEEYFTTVAPKQKKIRKRIKTKVTETPTISTTIEEKIQGIEMEDDYDISDSDSSREDIEIYKSMQSKRTTTKPTTALDIEENYPEKLQETSKIPTTNRPATQPIFPVIDPNSNSYVVWSLGQGGSGWSYQKHGDAVQWSAQNSEAEGDRWSVVGKEEKGHSLKDIDNQWVPIRNSSLPVQKSERIESKVTGDKQVYSSDAKRIVENNVSSVPYLREMPYKNETILNIRNPELPSSPYKLPELPFSQFLTPSGYLSSTIIQSNGKTTNFGNSTTGFDTPSQNIIQDPQVISFVSQTPFPVSPTLAAEYNEQIEGIINQYPIVPNYPYIAEIRETYSSNPDVVTSTSAQNPSVQELILENQDRNAEIDTTTPLPFTQQQFIKELQPNTYPTSFPNTEITSPYLEIITKIPRETVPVPNQLPEGNTTYPKYLSKIPPELAKAVVSAKKWKVVGSGGDDGWSLLNEDGVLEWKIHNVDGKWQINSAEQLLNINDPQQADKTEDLKSDVTNSGYIMNVKQGSPNVWTLDDDYAKWRAISAEKASPIDESLELSKSSEEYDYDNTGFNSDYYTDEEYYSGDEYNTGITTYNNNEDFGSKPLWGNGETQMIPNYPKNDYSKFAPNIEFGNSKEDAIAAWKSLLAHQGLWKFDDGLSSAHQAYSKRTEKQTIPQTIVRNADRRISTETPELKHEDRKQKSIFNKASKDQFKTTDRISSYSYDNHGKDFYDETQLRKEKQKDKDVSEVVKSNYGYASKTYEKHNDEDLRELSEETQQYYNFENTKTRNAEKQFENRVHVRDKDHSKIDSLINKLETIHKESKGRAVIDLKDLLRQIKARRNGTSSVVSRDRNSNIKPKAENQHPLINQENYKDVHADPQHMGIENNYQQQNSRGLHLIDNKKVSADLDNLKLLRLKTQYNQQKNDNFHRQDKYASDVNKTLDDILENLKSLVLKTRYPQQNLEKPEDLQKQNSYPDSARKSSSTVSINSRTNQSRTNIPEQNREVSIYNQQDSHSESKTRLSDNADGQSHDFANENQKKQINNATPNHRIRHSKLRNQANRRRRPTLKSQNRRKEEWTNKQSVSLSQQDRRYPPARPTEQYIREKDINQNLEKKDERRRIHSTVENNYSSHSQKHDAVKMEKGIPISEEIITDYLKGRNAYPSERQIVSQNVPSSYLQKQEPVVNFENSNAFSSEESVENYPKQRNTHHAQQYGVQQNSHPSLSQRYNPTHNTDKGDLSISDEIIPNYQKGRQTYQGPRYTEPRNKYPSYTREPEKVRNIKKGDSSSTEKIVVDLNDGKQNKRGNDSRRRVAQRKFRRPPHPAPVVLKGETDINDENGTTKSRKIIVIDYAGMQKKKNPIDKKDLELIIRNVKHRRSEILEDYMDSENKK